METYQIIIEAIVVVFASIGVARTVELVVSSLKTTSKHEIGTLNNANVILPGQFKYVSTDTGPYEELFNEINESDRSVLMGYLDTMPTASCEGTCKYSLKQMIFNGAKCKRELDALPKVDEVGLRKYCFEKIVNYPYPFYERFARAEVLYTYILTGIVTEKK